MLRNRWNVIPTANIRPNNLKPKAARYDWKQFLLLALHKEKINKEIRYVRVKEKKGLKACFSMCLAPFCLQFKTIKNSFV